jgi:hypothetical protein
MTLEGSCHCGAIMLTFATELAPSALRVRVCGCSFCVRHRPRYTSDPNGHVTIRARRDATSLYRFGLRLADFVICTTCGVFVAAHDGERGVINSAVLVRAAELTAEPVQFTSYDSEDAASRIERRAHNWTPATVLME